MSPVLINGHPLGVQSNGIFNSLNTDPIRPFGRLWTPAALSWNDMRLYIGKKTGHWIAPLGPASHARTHHQQVVLRAEWCAKGECEKAAKPGTSNHGWGIAVDVHHPKDAFYISKYGHKFGWSNDEGARVGEWWHYRYKGGYQSPNRHLAQDERRWVYEYRTLLTQKADKSRRRVLRRTMKERRNRIKRTHRKRGRWDSRSARTRYKILRRYS